MHLSCLANCHVVYPRRTDESFAVELTRLQGGWRHTIARAVQGGLPVATLPASLSYYDAPRRERLPANLT
jgi:6-phosphogluconate dehydrogenase